MDPLKVVSCLVVTLLILVTIYESLVYIRNFKLRQQNKENLETLRSSIFLMHVSIALRVPYETEAHVDRRILSELSCLTKEVNELSMLNSKDAKLAEVASGIENCQKKIMEIEA